MKRLILLGVLSSVVLIACRKETPLELPAGFEESAATCGNGIMDGNEDGIDCGTTTCTPCNLSHPIMCSNDPFDDNRAIIMDNSTTALDFTPEQVTSSTSSGVLVIEAFNGTKRIRATFSSATPDVFRSYECWEDPTPAEDRVYLQYIYGNYNYEAYSDNVHLNRENGKYTIEVCNAYMSDYFTPGYLVMKTRLISSN